VVLLIVFLSVTPLVVWNSRGFYYAYGWWQNVDFILTNGQIDESSLDYHSWPLTWILSAALAHVAGLDDPEVTITWAAFGLRLLYLAPLYLLLRTGLGLRGNVLWGALWLFSLGTWLQVCYSAQGLAFLLFIYLLSMLVIVRQRETVREMGRTIAQRLAAILVLGALTTVHALTSLAGLGAIAALSVLRRFEARSTAILAAVFISGWTIYEATAFFEWNVPRFYDLAFRLDLLGSQMGERASQSVSQAHRIRTVAQMVCVGAYGLLAAAGLTLAYVRRRVTSSDSVVLWMALGIWSVFLVLGASYGREHLERAFLLLLPALALFAAKLLSFRMGRFAFCGALFALILPLLVVHFAAEPANNVTPSYVAGLRFFDEQTTHGYIVGGGAHGLGEITFHPAGQYVLVPYEDLARDGMCYSHRSGSSPAADDGQPGYPTYVQTSEHLEAFYEYEFNDVSTLQQVGAMLNSSSDAALVYENPRFTLFVSSCSREASACGGGSGQLGQFGNAGCQEPLFETGTGKE